jgi:hypothetical protein
MASRQSSQSPDSGKPALFDRLGRPVKHGMHGSPEYRAWQQMRQRCQNPGNQRFDRYGGRGIKVCPRWDGSFLAFYADMGPRPSPTHSLDRIDNDGDYSPENCRWATRAEQNRNRGDCIILDHDGMRMTVAEWARHLGINVRTLSLRIEQGWDAVRALTTPVARRRWKGKPGMPLREEVQEAIDRGEVYDGRKEARP